MLHRVVWTLAGIAGVAVILTVLVGGTGQRSNPWRAPGWRRRLLWAGLLLLVGVGYFAPRRPAERQKAEGPFKDLEADKALDMASEIERLIGAWHQDSDTVRALLADAANCRDALAVEPPDDWAPSAHRLDFDLGAARYHSIRVTIPPSAGEVAKLRACARLDDAIVRARGRLFQLTGEICDTAEWQAVSRAWETAAPWASVDTAAFDGGETRRRHLADYRLELAQTAVGQLDQRGVLLPAEARLLFDEAERLRENVYKHAPSDNMVMCYVQFPVDPLTVSEERLRQRLALLAELETGRRMTAAVIEKVAGAIRGDLNALLYGRDRIRMAPLDGEAKPPIWIEVSRQLERLERN